MKTEKLNLRKRVKQLLEEQNQDKAFCNFQSQKALIRLYNFELFKNASCILAFVSCGTEIKTRQLLEIILTERKKLYIPRTENSEMDFYQIENDETLQNQLEIGEFGIPVPKKSLSKFDVSDFPENTLILVPGLAFDKNGNRLGKGKGFYDKFLEKLLESPCKKNILGFVGYCYDFQILHNVITEENDIPMDFVISEKQIVEVQHQ